MNNVLPTPKKLARPKLTRVSAFPLLANPQRLLSPNGVRPLKKRKPLLSKPTPVPTPLPVITTQAPVLQGYTPMSLLDLWERKAPWLREMRQFDGNSYMIPHNPAYENSCNPYHNALGARSFRAGLYIKFEGQTTKDWTCVSNKGFGNELPYITYHASSIGNEYPCQSTITQNAKGWEHVHASAKPVRLHECQGLDSLAKLNPLNDLRFNLFSLLHGMVELNIGGDPEFFSPTQPPNHPLATSSTFFVADGFAWEYHPTPYRCLNNVMVYWNAALATMQTQIALVASPRLELTPEIIAMVKPEQRELGCNPSENIYGMQGDLNTACTLPVRWAGGHLHFNLPPNRCTPDTVRLCVENLDALWGPASVAMLGHQDDTERRRYYGLAGEYRTKPYGFEYRTPSNQLWVKSLFYYTLVEIARAAVKLGVAGLSWSDIGVDTTSEEIIECINQNNIPLAQAIIKRNMTVYWAILASKTSVSRIGYTPMRAVLDPGYFGGLHYVSSSPLTEAWDLRVKLTDLYYEDWPEEFFPQASA